MSRNFSLTKQALNAKEKLCDLAQVAQQKCASTPIVQERIGLSKPFREKTILPKSHIAPVFALHFRILNTYFETTDRLQRKDLHLFSKTVTGPVCTKLIVPAWRCARQVRHCATSRARHLSIFIK